MADDPAPTAAPTTAKPTLKVESTAPANAAARRQVTLTVSVSGPITVDLADLLAAGNQANQTRVGSGGDFAISLPAVS